VALQRLVLDTNVVASALLWGGTPRLLLHAAHRGRVRLFTSLPLLLELFDVLSRPKFNGKIVASQLTVDQLVNRYAALTGVVQPMAVPRIVADPDDDVVVGTALAAQAGAIVTSDSSMLAVASYRNVRIVRVAQAIREMESV
jgi:putative PIN family toxin of toxin-antitoxin system